jgi:hypothetical protein
MIDIAQNTNPQFPSMRQRKRFPLPETHEQLLKRLALNVPEDRIEAVEEELKTPLHG